MVDITANPGVTAISGGDFAGYSPGPAFNDTFGAGTTQAWVSLQTNTSSPDQVTAAYIGIDLGEGVTGTVTQVGVAQHTSTANNSLVGADKIRLEYSDNGSDWTLHELLSPTAASVGGSLEDLALAGATPAKRFFRLFANGNVPGIAGSAWMMQEIEMIGTIGVAASGGGGGFGGLGTGRGRGRGRRR
jgi:hypothetical protein